MKLIVASWRKRPWKQATCFRLRRFTSIQQVQIWTKVNAVIVPLIYPCSPPVPPGKSRGRAFEYALNISFQILSNSWRSTIQTNSLKNLQIIKYNLDLRWRERTNKMQLIRCLLSNFYPNMFRASLCPSSGEQDRVLPHMISCTGSAGCGWLWSCGAASWVVCNFTQWTQLTTQLYTTTAQPLQNTICRSIRSCSPDDRHDDARNMLR